jgi:hypothetical protein
LQTNQLADASKWANLFRNQFGKKYSKAVGCDLEILLPSTDKAATVAAGGSIELSSKFADQTGAAITETINWSVSNGGTIDATTGTKVKFTAPSNGVYEVTASLASIPDLKDKIQIFVGDWWNPPVGVQKTPSILLAKAAMRFNYTQRAIFISTPFAGTLDIVGLNGRLVKSITVGSKENIELNTSAIGSGVYLVRLKGLQQEIKNKIVLR